ncbi:hypothetical protein NEOKW01_1148 [Nematocida sp. AWRm80]|nr:hypothetical protein NEOKW01_1148 [Nematocida sp. AWRm80]
MKDIILPESILINRAIKEGSICVSNTSGTDYAFKIKTTHPTNYKVRPSTGILSANSTITITINIIKIEDISKHKFLFQFIPGTKEVLQQNLKKLFSLQLNIIEKKIGIHYSTTEPKQEYNWLLCVSVIFILYYIIILIKKLVLG